MSRMRVVVSAENNAYLAWQCKLLHFSCVSRLRLTPTFVVHESGSDWHPGFRDIVRAGGVVRHAPSYAVTRQGQHYAPRNTAGTLLHAAGLCEGVDDFIVLCDPDMIFARAPEFPRALSGEFYSYMNYSHEVVVAAQRQMGLADQEAQSRGAELCIGVPYVIPVADAHRLAEAWLESLDTFVTPFWESIMYAFGLALVRLNLGNTVTRMMNFNYPADAALSSEVIHYCYGDETWSKRFYADDERARGVWETEVNAPRGTVLREIQTQLREAREFYSGLTF